MTFNPEARSARSIATQIAEGRASATATVDEHMERVSRKNTDLNALVAVFADQAMATARRIDATRASGKALGPLAGVSVSVKANIDVAGHPTTHGIPAFKDAVAPADAPLVERLCKADAVIVGHANIPDMAMRLHTSSALFGATRNLFDASLSPGGSSGGDGVAVGSGMVALGLGNDAGGSVRIPASFSGVCALKPTTGRFASDRAVGRDLTYASQVIPVDGFMAATIDDLQAAMEISTGADTRDPRAVPVPVSHHRSRTDRIAVVADPGGLGVHAEVRQAVGRAATALEDAGWEVVETDIPECEAALSAYGGLIMTEFSQAWPMLSGLVGKDVRRYLEHAMALRPPLPLDGYLAATAERMRLQRVWIEYIVRFDAILGPTYCDPIPEIDADIQSVDSHAACARAMRLCTASSLVGFPAVSLSVGSSGALPVGVQLVTAPFDEMNALALARQIKCRMALGSTRLEYGGDAPGAVRSAPPARSSPPCGGAAFESD